VSSLCRTFAGSYVDRDHCWEENHFIRVFERKQLAINRLGLWTVGRPCSGAGWAAHWPRAVGLRTFTYSNPLRGLSPRRSAKHDRHGAFKPKPSVARFQLVGNNSIQYTSCQKWVHRKCSGIKVACTCMIPVTSTGRTSADIGVNANLELVDKFCYLGDMWSVDGDADAAVENRIRIGWIKFRQLVPLLTNKDISLKVRGRLFSSCVRSSMLHGSETWPVRKENEVALHRTDENG